MKQSACWIRGAAASRWLTGCLLIGSTFTVVSCSSPKHVQSRQLKDVVKIAAGSTHSCAVTGQGHVKCWGDNKYGQLGDGMRTAKRVPVDVSGLMTAAKDVTVGERHTCAVTTVGGLKCWGSNHDFQLGDGTGQDRVSPVDVAELPCDVRAAPRASTHLYPQRHRRREVLGKESGRTVGRWDHRRIRARQSTCGRAGERSRCRRRGVETYLCSDERRGLAVLGK